MENPKKYSDGPLVIPAAGPGESDTFIAAPLPVIERAPKVGDIVDYWPSPRAPQGPSGALRIADSTKPMEATVDVVHSQRLVNLRVVDHAGTEHTVLLVTLVHAGDPDPCALTGRCSWPSETETIGAGDVGRVEDVLGPQ